MRGSRLGRQAQSLNRHEKPRPRRKLPRPRDDKAIRPTRLETETPDFDKFRNVDGPIRFLRRKTRPTKRLAVRHEGRPAMSATSVLAQPHIDPNPVSNGCAADVVVRGAVT